LAALYEEQVRKLEDPPYQISMLLRLARVYEEELAATQKAHAVDKAITTYRRVLDVEADQKIAILALDRLYHATQRWGDLGEILRLEIRLAENDDAIIDLEFRLGQL